VSFGGLVAYEIARQLKVRGEAVECLALVETVLPRAIELRPLRWLENRIARLQQSGLSYVTDRASQHLARAFETLRSLRGPPTLQEARFVDHRNTALRRALQAYDVDAEPYHGDVLLFRASDEPRFPGYSVETSGGFARLVTGKLDVHEVSGNHQSILELPHVATLATKLARHLNVIDAIAAPSPEARQKPSPAVHPHLAQQELPVPSTSP
jgi:thioesterase domain-containing protein